LDEPSEPNLGCPSDVPRIHGELLKLGMNIGETIVSKYMVRHRRPASQTWRTFVENHVRDPVSVDFFTVREDCGGPLGYQNLLAAIRDPAHEEHAAMLEWMGGSFDAETFDIAAANRALIAL
jgi:hypothetical protein